MPSIREPGIVASLRPCDRELFLSKCTERRYLKGEHLCMQGSLHKESFIIKDGVVRTYHASPFGRAITLGYWSADDLVGGPYFFDECRHVWSAEAVTDTAVFRIASRDFRELTTHVPEIAERVLDSLSFKLYWFSLLLQMLGTESVPRRLAHLLLILSQTHGDRLRSEAVLRRHFTQEELGNMIGATRQWVSRALAEFKREGFLRYREDHIIILNVDRMSAYLGLGSARGW